MRPKHSNTISLALLFSIVCTFGFSQNLTFSPYSRYALGELNTSAFSHISAMGGTFIGLKPDTTAPLNINIANPAAITGIRLTTLELGGNVVFSEFANGKSAVKTRNINFSYASLGFPIKQKAAACFGLMPYSSVGYNLQNVEYNDKIGGNINYKYSGDGGINKAFLGFAISPFKSALVKFNNSAEKDSLVAHQNSKKYKKIKFRKELLSQFSIGGRGDYLFGNTLQTASVVYPNSNNYNNTRRYRAVTYNDFTGSFGIQTSFSIDSIKNRELRRKVKVGFGYFMALPNTINVQSSNLGYNYSLNSFGDETPKDTFIYAADKPMKITLPLEQGIGISIRKGELFAIAADASYINWQQFQYLDAVNDLSNSYRYSVGMSITPNKYASGSGAYLKRVQYRIGGYYKTGALELKQTKISDYGVTVGLALPVGMRVAPSVINLSAQFGQMGSINNNLIRERYARIIIGFTFNDKWFNKFRYD